MIVILVIVVTLSRLEWEVTGDHLENCACKRPNVSWWVVLCTNDNFWRSILSGLDLWSKVMMSPTSITHITNLYHDRLINLSSSLTLQIFEFFFHIVNSLFTIVNCSTSCCGLVFSLSISLKIIENLIVILFLISIHINIYIVNLTNWSCWFIIYNRLIVLGLTQINRWSNLWVVQFIFLLLLSLQLLS